SYARRKDQPKRGITQVDAGTAGRKAKGNIKALSLASYFGRIKYNYSEKYLLEFDFRTDASSRFAKGNRWGVFPGFSAGWRVTNEKFMEDQNIFSNLLIRGSIGRLG